MSISVLSSDPISNIMLDPFSQSLLDLPFAGRDQRSKSFLSPRVDIYDSDECFKIIVDLPGVPKENLLAEVRGQNLHVEGKTMNLKDYEGFKNVVGERRHGKYSRVISLPLNADPLKVTADYKDGLLTMTVAKKKEPKPKKIEIF